MTNACHCERSEAIPARHKMNRKTFNIVIVGHVDHGKSTVLGRLLADTNSLGKGKLEQVKSDCEKNSKLFEYAFLIDALKDEQSQGITIDTARVFFKTKKRNYLFLDAPGHIEFLRNMVTGASKADAALLIIDANERVQENTKRHAFILSMLGIKEVAVVVNKMDLVSYSQKEFKEIVRDCDRFLSGIGIKPLDFIPVSAITGDNIAKKSRNLSWHKANTLLKAIESFKGQKDPMDKPFRMPVQDVYKFTNFNDNRRIIAGTVVTGSIKTGDEVLFYPSGKKTTVKSIEAFNAPSQSKASAGDAVGITLSEQLYIKRGDTAISSQSPLPQVATRIKVSIFWLSKKPMVKNKDYIFKLGTSRITARIDSIHKTIDTSDLSEVRSGDRINRNYMAECVLQLDDTAAFDLKEDFLETGRFIIVDDCHISGGGIILQALVDKSSDIRDKVLLRNYKWIKSLIPSSERQARYGHSSCMVFITGSRTSARKALGKALEEHLFKQGKFVYFFGIGNILYGLDADIETHGNNIHEHLRRLCEVSQLMLEAGMILIVSAIGLRQDDIDLMKFAVDPEKMKVIWLGKKVSTDIDYDLKIDSVSDMKSAVKKAEELLIDSKAAGKQV